MSNGESEDNRDADTPKSAGSYPAHDGWINKDSPL